MVTSQVNVEKANVEKAPPVLLHRIWYERGKALTKQGRYEAALASFNQALSLQPNEHQLWVYRGVALAYLKHYELALASFDQALELASNNREAWIFRGSVLTYLKRDQEAAENFRTVLEIQQRGFTICEEYPTDWLPPPSPQMPLGILPADRWDGLNQR